MEKEGRGEGRKAGDDGDDDMDGMMGRLEWVVQIWWNMQYTNGNVLFSKMREGGSSLMLFELEMEASTRQGGVDEMGMMGGRGGIGHSCAWGDAGTKGKEIQERASIWEARC